MRHLQMLFTSRQRLLGAAWLAHLFCWFAVAPRASASADSAQTYIIVQPDWPLWQMPSRTAARRGALAHDARVTPFAVLTGSGCQNPWWQVGAYAWMCPDNATLLPASASPSDLETPRKTDVLGYVMVGKNGVLGYDRRENVDVGSPNAEMQPGFMLGFTDMADTRDATIFLTTHGLWISSRDVQVLKPSDFHGSAVDGELDIAWVYEKRAQVFSAPDVRQMPARFVNRLTPIAVQGQQQRPSGLWLKYEGGWLKSSALRTAQLQQPPAEVGTDEHWIDVDTTSQILVAYVGTRPVFATLVSTGRGKAGTPQATPVGIHRVWIKLRQSDMDNLDVAEAKSPYAVEAVPHVMFFEAGYGIHGTYWHDDFGVQKSHGCVNVSLADARWLFQFASPHLPVGWSAVFPTGLERGTLVRVR
jgi:lipoprotein-anchoring transpeptidase ErfK/SrfK